MLHWTTSVARRNGFVCSTSEGCILAEEPVAEDQYACFSHATTETWNVTLALAAAEPQAHCMPTCARFCASSTLELTLNDHFR
jgi:hypothetical protein